jgi:hypothetical protein
MPESWEEYYELRGLPLESPAGDTSAWSQSVTLALLFFSLISHAFPAHM